MLSQVAEYKTVGWKVTSSFPGDSDWILQSKFYWRGILSLASRIPSHGTKSATLFLSHICRWLPWIGHFRVPPGLCFKTRVGAQPLIWKSFFILLQIKLIFTRKVVHLASFWKRGFFETRKWPIHSSSLFPCNILYYIIAIIFVLFCVIEIIEKGPKEMEEEVEATRIDLAKRNMQIQSLQYDLYKLQEKYDNDVHALKKEVEWGREKVGSLKLEIRRLKEHEPEDTISLIRWVK